MAGRGGDQSTVHLSAGVNGTLSAGLCTEMRATTTSHTSMRCPVPLTDFPPWVTQALTTHCLQRRDDEARLVSADALGEQVLRHLHDGLVDRCALGLDALQLNF